MINNTRYIGICLGIILNSIAWSDGAFSSESFESQYRDVIKHDRNEFETIPEEVESLPFSLEEQDRLDKIIHGSFSNTYKIIFEGEEAAIKYIAAAKLPKADSIRNALREINVLRSISNEHIPTFKHSYIILKGDGAGIYIVMQCCPGYALPAPEVRSIVVEPDTVALIVYQVAMILLFLEQNAILYRDLKIENILYCKEEKKVYLVDFGFARFLPERERSNSFTSRGADETYAPEILKQEKYGADVMVWALARLWLQLYGIENFYCPDVPAYDPSKHRETLKSNVAKWNERKVSDRFDNLATKIPNANAIPLLTRMLDPNPDSRITLEEIIAHPYFDKELS